MSFAFGRRWPRNGRPRRPETPEEAKARRLAAQRRKGTPCAGWWREQMGLPAVPPAPEPRPGNPS